MGFHVFANIYKPMGILTNKPHWYSEEEIGLGVEDVVEWFELIKGLSQCGISLNPLRDKLVWYWNTKTGL